MEIEMKHFSHDHVLVLKAYKLSFVGTDSEKIKCDGCLETISGPFYSCKECNYNLEKVCAELPKEMNHPSHTQHPLILLTKPPFSSIICNVCDICCEKCERFIYHCSECDFDVDPKCASTSLTIKDKCHPHPLAPVQNPSIFPCDICHKEDKGASYKCTTCPFWVHQNCTLLPSIVECSRHEHPLKLLDSRTREDRQRYKKCDICKTFISKFICTYHCGPCKFIAHIPCATRTNDDHDQGPALLPVRHESWDLILQFVEGKGIRESYLKNELDHFGHYHPLSAFKEDKDGKICEACIQPISYPYYGCIECCYFLHQICTDLPNSFRHPFHLEHEVQLFAKFPNELEIFSCSCCNQLCNGFGYKCAECDKFYLDIKCASLIGLVKHEAHRHYLDPTITPSDTCDACGGPYSGYSLKCTKCKYNLSQNCAMSPLTITHRYGKGTPFTLTYSPFENHSNEYICELCEYRYLNPKEWHYHCITDDQFVHATCMRSCASDSNIKYGKRFKVSIHPHDLSLVPLTYEFSTCKRCGERLNVTTGVGLECQPCKFKVHVACPV